MEILQAVRARGERWRVAAVRAYDTCRLVTLTDNTRIRRVLTPFDDVEPIERNDRPSTVTARRWRHSCRALIAADAPPGRLRTAARAHIELLPHQLEPALAILRGAGSRLLLADDVGLGKTIQAGLLVAELLARGCVDRVLILTPAGVRDQWAGELQQRFEITAARADAASLRQLVATLPLGVNPWQTMPIAIASIDYVKRLEVLPAVRSVRWDVVVIDEAHTAAGDSERRDAVRLIAERAAYVVLLTATPHNGDDAAFEELCRIGAIAPNNGGEDERLLVFRRTRDAIRAGGSRHVHVLRVRPSVAERHMYEALARYRGAVAAEHGDRALALCVLDKRAFSSPWSLAQSVDRRLASLVESVEDATLQLTLPLGDPDGELTDEDVPPIWPGGLALADAREDRRLLTAVAAAARSAALHDDSKLRCLQRLLRRMRESALVFTEYRDSAVHLRSAIGRPTLLLHGGLDRRERALVVDQFTRRPGTILIATDAAGQGLNLHHHCRFVVNVELPWNPMRLEQRIGRVDRIGQGRRVHAVHFVAAATGEAAILERLQVRVARARTAIGAPSPLGALGNDGGRDAQSPPWLTFADESQFAEVEAGRLTRARMVSCSIRIASDAPLAVDHRPFLVHVRRRRLKTALAGRTLLIYRVACEDADGRVVESGLVSLLIDRQCKRFEAATIPASAISAWQRDVAAITGVFHATRAARERAIAGLLASAAFPLFQPALFDRRADQAHRSARTELADAVHDADMRLALIDRQGSIGVPSTRLLLIAQP